MPNRVIRADVVLSDRYRKATKEARLVFFEVLLAADDYGCLELSDGFLMSHCPSLCDTDAAASTDHDALRLLFELDLLRPYVVGDHRYAYVPRFRNWPRARRPRYPIPPDDIGGTEVKALIKNRKQRSGARSADAVHVHSKRSADALHVHRTRSADAVHVHSTRSARAVHMRGVTETETETVTETGTVTEKIKDQKNRNVSRASRMTMTQAPATWIEFCSTKRPDLDARETFASFRDYWTALPGSKGSKLDWFATWRNWVRRQEARRRNVPETIDFAALDAELAAKGSPK